VGVAFVRTMKSGPFFLRNVGKLLRNPRRNVARQTCAQKLRDLKTTAIVQMKQKTNEEL